MLRLVRRVVLIRSSGGAMSTDCSRARAPERGPTFRRRGRRAVRAGCVITLACGLLVTGGSRAQGAEPEDVALQEITWAHPSPSDVARFVIYLSSTRGAEQSARQIDVGKPRGVKGPAASPMRYFSAVVPTRLDDFVAVAAIARDGTRSPLSAWAGVPPGRPGRPALLEP
jgi:hypothetical protein